MWIVDCGYSYDWCSFVEQVLKMPSTESNQIKNVPIERNAFAQNVECKRHKAQCTMEKWKRFSMSSCELTLDLHR